MKVIHIHEYSKKIRPNPTAIKIVDRTSRYYAHVEDNKILNLKTFEKIKYEGDLVYFDDEYLVSVEDDFLMIFKIETAAE